MEKEEVTSDPDGKCEDFHINLDEHINSSISIYKAWMITRSPMNYIDKFST